MKPEPNQRLDPRRQQGRGGWKRTTPNSEGGRAVQAPGNVKINEQGKQSLYLNELKNIWLHSVRGSS